MRLPLDKDRRHSMGRGVKASLELILHDREKSVTGFHSQKLIKNRDGTIRAKYKFHKSWHCECVHEPADKASRNTKRISSLHGVDLPRDFSFGPDEPASTFQNVTTPHSPRGHWLTMPTAVIFCERPSNKMVIDPPHGANHWATLGSWHYRQIKHLTRLSISHRQSLRAPNPLNNRRLHNRRDRYEETS